MQINLLYLFVSLGGICLFVSFFLWGVQLAGTRRRKLLIPTGLLNTWREAVEKEEDEHWERLLNRSGRLFGWGKAEWIGVQWMSGVGLLVILLLWAVLSRAASLSLLFICLIPCIGYFFPYLILKGWAGIREETLSLDIARFVNRYANLLENQVPPYDAMVKAARPTRKLKHYIPSLSEWNRDRFQALERLKRDLGIDDAVMLVSNMRTVEQLSPDMIALTMHRLEWTVDNRRMHRHRKKLKSLGIGYSIIVYPAFYIGLIVAMFPWYKLLTEILDKYLT
ncbi:hypothetical protein LOK74_21655 [Brevibacillus humidisoli]|uniref:hypothetical protein n=1 Tax=Brevibacillus humidisoli TaxID=2895522 RepID=UPI001E3B6108|nr:hypothetical protein [Brevibacillus humidisoli]UFJ40593.1 hypothetical protein LOK74_21655 [Brevibacillus humidisoli]